MVTNGRYRTMPERFGGSGGVELAAGPYLVLDDTGGWTIGDGGEIARGTGLVEAGTDEPSAAGIRAIAEAVRSYGPERLYEVSPLLPALGRRFRLEAADVAIIETLSSLEAIARAPYCRLKTTTEFLPTGQVKRMARRAPIYLSSRSDHWGRRTVSSVSPMRLLAERSEERVEIHENEVVASLIKRSARLLDRRIEKVERVKAFFEAAANAARRLEGRPWRANIRLANLLGEAVADFDQKQATIVAGRLEEARQRVGALEDGEFVAAFGYLGNRVVAPLNTNLFRDDHRYRDVITLWTKLRRSNAPKSVEEEMRERQAECGEFVEFCALLVYRALWDFGVTLASGPVVRGATAYFKDGVALDWSNEDVLTLSVQGAKVRLVPILHAFQQVADPLLLRRALESISAGAARASAPTVVLFPASSKVSDALSGSVVNGLDALPHERVREDHLGLIPVGPLEADSLERVTRLVRWQLYRDRMTRYPIAVTGPRVLVGRVVASGFGWVRATDRSETAEVVRPAKDDEVLGLDTFMTATPRRVASPGGQVPEWSALRPKFVRAAEEMKVLAECPCCGVAGGGEHSFEARADGTYWCTCSGYDTQWGIRTCRCGGRFPVLIPPGVDRLPEVRLAGWITTYLGSEGLASPCWHTESLRYFVCPECGECGADERTRSSCVRCATRDVSGP